MGRHTYYDLCHELKDGTISAAFVTYTTKRTAVRIARAVAKRPVADAWNVVVMDTNEKVAVAVFPIPPKSAP